MSFLIEIFYAILLILGGLGIIKYRRMVKGWTGSFYWAEKHIGNGGTYFILIIIGAAMIFFGAMYPFGGMEILLQK